MRKFIRKFMQISMIFLLTAMAMSGCRPRSDSGLNQSKDGGRTGDGAGFENIVPLREAPDYQATVRPFLQAFSRYHPTMARLMMEHAESPRASFLKSSDNRTHYNTPARAYVDYGLNAIVFFDAYWKADERERLKIWFHELTHKVFRDAGQNPENEESIVVLIETLIGQSYDHWKAGRTKEFEESMVFLCSKYLGPQLRGLAAKADIERDIGEYAKIPIFKHRSDLTYPVAKSILNGQEFLPILYEVSINRLWSREVRSVEADTPVFGTAEVVKMVPAAAKNSYHKHPMWQYPLLFPKDDRPWETILGPSNMGDPHYVHLIKRAELSAEFLSYSDRMKQKFGISWIRTLYNQGTGKLGELAGDELPALDSNYRRDYVILMVD
jgi:hypothetical protein